MKKLLFLLCLLLIASPCFAIGPESMMAGGGGAVAPITFDAISSAPPNGSTTNVTTTLTWNHVCAGSNRLLLVQASNSNSALPITSITYDSVALTRLASSHSGTGGTLADQEVWYLVAPNTGTKAILITYSVTQGGTYPSAGAVSFTGVNQTTPFHSQGANSYVKAADPGSSQTASSVTVASATGQVVVDFIGTYQQAATKGASQTLGYSSKNYTGGSDAGSSYQAGAVSVTNTWTFAADYWSDIAVSLQQP